MTGHAEARLPARVLIAEDSATQAELIRSLLEEHSFDVRLARNGREALGLIRSDQPHIVISDVVMPEMDGYALCRAIKADPQLRDIPVVLVTTLADPTNVVEGINCGADNFITKPYDEKYLLARIDYLLANREMRDASNQSSALRVEIDGNTHDITARSEQILDMLMSVYSEATRFSEEARARELSLREVNNTLQLLNRSAAALNAARSESEVIAAALASTRRFGFVQAAWMILTDAAGAVRRVETGGPAAFAADGATPSAQCSCHTDLFSGVLTEPRNAGTCGMLAPGTTGAAGNVTSHAAVPLISGERRLGILGLLRQQGTPFQERELQIFATLGGQLAPALDRAQLHERQERTIAERTAQLRMEIEERVRTEALLRDAIESVAGGIAIFDADERLVICNQSYRKLYPEAGDVIAPGVSFEHLVRTGLARSQYIYTTEREDEWLARTLRQFRERTGIFEQRLNTGQTVVVTHRAMANGWTAGLRVDITETRDAQKKQQELQEQLAQAQKMESIGNLIGGLAHDFNNLLGIVIGNLDLAKESVAGNEDLRVLVTEALEGAERGADLTHRLLAFARRQALRPEQIDVADLVDNVTRLLRRLIGEDIELAIEPPPQPLWPVIADPAQLQAAIVNLAVNARDAMPNGGRLIVTTANRGLDADYAAENHGVTPGDYAMIAVTDTGTGIPPELLATIFEPFFTTKEVGKGTGLGLSMIFGFMKQSGGHVSVYSEPGKGTTFRLYLPRAQTEEQAAAAADPTPAPQGTGETILVVEDNDGLRRIVVRQLLTLGYRAGDDRQLGGRPLGFRRRVARQEDAERRAAGLRVGVDVAAGLLDDSVDSRKP